MWSACLDVLYVSCECWLMDKLSKSLWNGCKMKKKNCLLYSFWKLTSSYSVSLNFVNYKCLHHVQHPKLKKWILFKIFSVYVYIWILEFSFILKIRYIQIYGSLDVVHISCAWSQSCSKLISMCNWYGTQLKMKMWIIECFFFFTLVCNKYV